jgi:hypothetical protein
MDLPESDRAKIPRPDESAARGNRATKKGDPKAALLRDSLKRFQAK